MSDVRLEGSCYFAGLCRKPQLATTDVWHRHREAKQKMGTCFFEKKSHARTSRHMTPFWKKKSFEPHVISEKFRVK